jgi:hypothetical protein
VSINPGDTVVTHPGRNMNAPAIKQIKNIFFMNNTPLVAD